MFILNKELFFPPVKFADKDGMFAIGGDLSTKRLLLGYRNGIFPWYNENEPICWYCPDPRFVLFPAELNISNSMKTVINSDVFSFTVNKAFDQVIKNCKNVLRKDQPGTWISDAIIEAYSALHLQGHAHSAEAWSNGELVGGLYGIRMGKVFFGESMFNKKSNASKFAFIKYVQYLKEQDVQLIDCQVYTRHLQSLGAKMIERDYFLQLLNSHIN
ncbi:MAG: leucyl/phenylalanyl-tRNA--protein transferase [Ginsengibacter sp.]